MGFFTDEKGNKSSKRLNAFIVTVSGVCCTIMALVLAVGSTEDGNVVDIGVNMTNLIIWMLGIGVSGGALGAAAEKMGKK